MKAVNNLKKEFAMGRSLFLSMWLATIVASVPSFSQNSEMELYVEQIQTVNAFGSCVMQGAVSLKGNVSAFISEDKKLRIYAVPSLAEKSPAVDLPQTVNSLAFSASGSTIAMGATDGQVRLLDVSTAAITKSFAIHTQRINAILFQDEGWVFSGGVENTLAITDAVGASSIGTVSTSSEITALAITPDASNCAVGMIRGEVGIVSIGDLSINTTLTDAQERISAICYSTDGKFLAAGTVSGNIFVWNAKSHVLQKVFEQKGGILTIAFDPKTRWMASASSEGTLNIYDLSKMTPLKILTEKGGYITFTSFINDETMLTATSTGQIKSWRVALTPPDTADPVIVTERPVFGSVRAKTFSDEYEIRGLAYDDGGLKEIKVNGRSVSLLNTTGEDAGKIPAGIKYAKRFSAVIKLDSTGPNPYEIKVTDKAKHTTVVSGEIQRLAKSQALEIVFPPNNSEVGDISLPLKFRTYFDVANYSISNNMIDITVNQVPNVKSVGEEISENISLFMGYNQVQLTVTDKSGEKYTKVLSLNRVLGAPSIAESVPVSEKAVDKKPRPASGPQSWAVVVGVSEYKNPGIPGLKYADKDAEALADFLRRPEGGGYDSEHIRVLLNKDATLANVKDALINFLNQAIDMDLVMIYFAGHGAPEPARPQNIYLLTYDSDPNALGTTAFPMWDIQTVLSRYINAKRVIVFSDACHSGNISVNFATRGVGVTEQNLVNQYLTDLSRSKEGVIVFTASASGEVSQEFPEMGHGVFTYYLLEGMKGKADYNNDYTVTINELMQYVEEQVKRKTRGSQNPTRSQTDYDKEMTVSIIPQQ
jgi:WD40 repeat protein